MSLLTPVIRRALRLRAPQLSSARTAYGILAAPLQQTPFQSEEFQVLHRYRDAVAKFYPRSVAQAAPGSA